MELNTPLAVLLEHVRVNSARKLPWITETPPHDKIAILVGGGPSLAERIDEIRWRQNAGGVVFAQNGAAKFLAERGVIPDYQVIVDGRQITEKLVCFAAHEYLLSSQVHPNVLAHAAAGQSPVTLFHPGLPGISAMLPDLPPFTPCFIGGGVSVGLASMALVHCMGYKTMRLYGYDSSMRVLGSQHAYPQERTTQEAEEIEVVCEGRKFLTTPQLLTQAQEFEHMARMLSDLDCVISVHGDGLLPTVARAMLGHGHPGGIAGNGAPLRLRYDLATSPPTWDFVSWMFNAHVYQKKYGFGPIEVQFMPGPFEGFRHDPSLTTLQKQQMLEHVCRPALAMFGAKEIRDGGQPIDFPYTIRMTVDAVRQSGFELPLMRPSQEARKWAEQYRGCHIITLREADYWPERNSDIEAWKAVAQFLEDHYDEHVVFVRDTARSEDEIKGHVTIPVASESLDCRLALYCVAKMNYFVSNGPCVLAGYSIDIPYLTFMKSVPGYVCNGDGWMRRHMGIGHGEQWPWAGDRQKLVYADDTFENIMQEYGLFRAYWAPASRTNSQRKTA